MSVGGFKTVRSRRGFTLVEMLVVIGIIVILLSILVPTVFALRRQAEKKRTVLDLQAIAAGLEAYKNDFKDYPKPPMNARSEKVLAWALLGPFPATSADIYHDGAEGLGFRTTWDNAAQTGGRVWGPYIPADRFKLEIFLPATLAPPAIQDRYGQKIEYFPRWRNYTPNIPLFNAYLNGPGMFDSTQAYDGNSVNSARKALGDTGNLALPNPTQNDRIDTFETLKGPPGFLLLSKGPRKTDWKEPVTNLDE